MNIPVLLPEIKTSFHNIFAHPFWLYHNKIAEEKYKISVKTDDNNIYIEHNWQLGDLRTGFLQQKIKFWRELFNHLKTKGYEFDNAREFMRAALFCCPSLVINLRAGADKHNATTSMLGLVICVMLSCEPKYKQDVVNEFLDGIFK